METIGGPESQWALDNYGAEVQLVQEGWNTVEDFGQSVIEWFDG